jgi:hypothetical protein
MERANPPERERAAIDRGEFRDKVAAPDPATVGLSADQEAAGAPASASDGDRPTQARAAYRHVPRLDPDRAVSTDDHPEAVGRRRRLMLALGAGALTILGGTVALVIVALPG